MNKLWQYIVRGWQTFEREANEALHDLKDLIDGRRD